MEYKEEKTSKPRRMLDILKQFEQKFNQYSRKLIYQNLKTGGVQIFTVLSAPAGLRNLRTNTYGVGTVRLNFGLFNMIRSCDVTLSIY